ncbi:MAG: DUF116 domain-containing protein [Elusimicrobiota bacterium]|jgi:hypothetical protein|nr:DUF116 domain-containing protein [Elusimicrobiota bacterium]
MNLCKNKTSKIENYKKFTQKQNKIFAKSFINTPVGKRVIFMPHCMRNVKVCKAVEHGSYYICACCGGCKIGQIYEMAKSLGYRELFILKGGRAILKIIDEIKPEAVVGAACFFEGKEAFVLLKDKKIAVQFVALSRDGCADTDINIEDVKEILKQ